MNAIDSDDCLRKIDALNSQGQGEAALALAETAVRAGSARLPIYFRLAAACLKAGRYRDALEVTKSAAQLAPGAPGELIELAKRLMYFNQSGLLRDVATRLLAKPVWHATAEADFAALLSMVGEQALASSLLDRAIAVVGATPATIYNRSQMHLYSGRLEAAEADLRQCLKLEPAMAKACWALSKLPHTTATVQELASVRSLASRVAPGSQDEVFLRFALFNRLDQAGQYDQAWAELARGCQAKRRLVSFDPEAAGRFFEALLRMPAATPAEPMQRNAAATTPIFIVGMHRSGTTLLERILGSHSKVSAGGELYDFPAQLRLAIGRHFTGSSDIAVVERMPQIDFADVGRRYLEHVDWRTSGKPFLIDKLPSNFLNVGFIHRALPQARVIHMRRNAMDTCFSNLKELFSNACAYSYDQLELADYYAHYRRLMAHWRQVAPKFILDVSYEELARNPQAQAERILAFCGLEWEPGCIETGGNTRAVNTASSAQVREPIHQRGIEAWRRYQPWLGPLAARLESHGLD